MAVVLCRVQMAGGAVMTAACPIQSSINTKAIQDGIEWDKEVWLEKRAEEIKQAILSEDGYTVNSATYGVGDVLERIAGNPEMTEAFEQAIQAMFAEEKADWITLNNARQFHSFFRFRALELATELASNELAATKIYEGL